MSPSSLARSLAGVAIVLVLVAVATTPAPAQTHASTVQAHA